MDDVIDEWRTLFQSYSQSLHLICSFEIEIQAGEAECSSLVQSLHIDTSGQILQSFGSYRDALIFNGGTWKISRRIYREVARLPMQSI
jgi:hypothetical protein